MNNIKLYEAYNREETLLGLVKMGLRNNRKEVFDLAVSRGFNIEGNFDVLKSYCIEIVNYNSMGWIYTNNQDYLNHINYITVLYIDNKNLTDLKGIENLTNLTELYCHNSNLSNLKGIEKLSQLNSLFCSKNNLPDLKGIESLSLLTYLFCSNNDLTSLEGISELTNLKSLSCSGNNLTTLKGVENLHQLDKLYCKENPLPQEIIYMDSNNNKDIEGIKKYYR